MKKIILMVAGLLLVPVLATATVSTGDVSALNLTNAIGDNGQAKGDGVGNASVSTDWVKNVINFLLYAIGVIAVIMIIWGGIKYATSAGDSNKVTSAKNTILYAVIGLIVAIFAFAIVNFVLTQTTA